MSHKGRCVKITCNFTHPSAQTGNRVYPAHSYIYSYEADNVVVRGQIEKHAKKKYASEERIRAGWMGFIATNDQMLFNKKADSDLTEVFAMIP